MMNNGQIYRENRILDEGLQNLMQTFRISSVNVRSLIGSTAEVVNTVNRGKIDVVQSQKMRYNNHDT